MPRPSRAKAPRLQLRRGRAGHLQGPRHPALQPPFGDRRHDHRRLRDGLRAGYNYIHGEIFDVYQRFEEAPPRPAKPACSAEHPRQRFRLRTLRPSRLRRLHLRRRDRAAGVDRGQEGQPRFKPPFPASYGLYGKPTTINNTEPLPRCPFIINDGGEAFSTWASPTTAAPRSSRCPATSNRPATIRVRLGTPFSELLEMAGGVRGGASSRR